MAGSTLLRTFVQNLSMHKIGVIGAGHLGKIHLNLLSEISKVELIGFYDTDKSNTEEVSKSIGLPAFNSVDELIVASDIVDIVTPTLSHYEIAVSALKKSKHLFIEKPMTNSVAEAKELIELTHEAGVKVQVGHVERFNPAFLAAVDYCSDPMFIETHRLAQFNPRGTDVPVVLDLMIHDIDIVLSVVKSNIKRISASGVAVVSDSPDIANARIEFDNGCVANLTASRISLKNMRKTRLFQRDAYITIDFLEKEVELIKLRTIEDGEETDPLAVIIDLGNDAKKKQLYFDSPAVGDGNAIKMELESLIESIDNDSVPLVSVEDGCAALSVAHQVLDQMRLTESIA